MYINLKNECVAIALLRDNLEDKRRNKTQRADKYRNLKRHILLVIVAKLGDYVLHHLASSLSNVIGQVGRQAEENFNEGDFF